jgi:hypothetical protein
MFNKISTTNYKLVKNENKIMLKLCLDYDDITKDEFDVFYKIFCDMMINKVNDFLLFYTNELIIKYNKNNKYLYKIDINIIIDKYFTNQIKQIDYYIYNKYNNNNKTISHELIILLINDIWMKDDDMVYFNLYIYNLKKE